jgi:hypothetical protein
MLTGMLCEQDDWNHCQNYQVPVILWKKPKRKDATTRRRQAGGRTGPLILHLAKMPVYPFPRKS